MRVRPQRRGHRWAILAATAAATLSGVVGASGDARTISLYHIHTKETLTILYKKDGRYIPEALKKLNWFLRDWRRDEATTMDPRTIDIVWEMHAELGSLQPVHIISAYRSRNTNEMLRKTRGGQASQSQHITGKAMDVHFPDVPIRRLRYSAMIRERGGVGYYPTSALPFVHVDTARVRSWPRMTHDELALLFPSGRSKHLSAEGRSLSPGDAAQARRRHPQLAQQVAQYFDLRANPRKSILVASADGALPTPSAPQSAARPAGPQDGGWAGTVVAALPPPAPRNDRPEPKLVREPRPVERSSRFTTGPSNDDRSKLNDLLTLAAHTPASEPLPKLVALPQLAKRPVPKPAFNTASATGLPSPGPASLSGSDAATAVGAPPASLTAPSGRPGLPNAAVAALQSETVAKAAQLVSWVTAPAWDDDHPEELAYQPFPILPLLTETASADDPALARMVHPDAARTFDMLDDEGRILPMRLRPGAQAAQLLLAQQFTGDAVHLADIEARALELERQPAPAAFAERIVKTSPR